MYRNGDVTGGKGKLFCPRDRELDSSVVYDLVKTPCRDIIEYLRTLFRYFCLHTSAGQIRGSDTLTVYEAKRK